MMPTGKLDKAAIIELAEILKQTDLSEIEFEANGVKIKVARQLTISGNVPQLQGLPNISTGEIAAHTNSTDHTKHPGMIKSPMVGTVYLSPEPGAATFIKIGDNVSVGQNLLIIEAMKVMNTIKAPQSGVVKKILVRDTDPVEFDTPLLIIE